jgi:hypothetical protein
MTPEISRAACKAIQKQKNRAAAKFGITINRLFKELDAELEATEQKVFNDKESGIVYSQPMIAWKIRQEARRDAEAHLGIKPADKSEIEHKGNVTFEVVDYGDKGKAKKGNGNGSKG